MNLNIKHEKINEVLCVFLTGEVDAYTAPKLRETLIPLTEEKAVEIVIDLTGVDYIDSTGLGVFIGALKSSHNHSSSIKLRGLSKRVARLFKITGLDEVLEIEEEKGEEVR